MQYSEFLPDEKATLAFGAKCASLLKSPAVVYLMGDLGAGKTTFVRGLLEALGHQGTVKSPTYTIVESYSFNHCSIHHFDLYRFTTPEEWEDAGLDELINHESICLIEWPLQAEGYVPQADWIIQLEHRDNGRVAYINTMGYHQQELSTWQS